MKFENVTATAKANVYFDGKVVSHTITFADGAKKTLGLIYAGEFHFGTDAAERMDITRRGAPARAAASHGACPQPPVSPATQKGRCRSEPAPC